MEKGIAAVTQQIHGEFEHIIMCLTTGGDSEKMLPGEVQVIALHKPAGNSLYFILQLAKQLKALKPDVVHTRNWGGLDGIIAARLAGIRGVVHGEHGWGMEDPRGQNPKRRMIRLLLARFVKEFTCVSRQMVSWLEADIRVGRPVTQIYNGIDTQRYRPKKGISTETVSGTEPKPVPGAELSSEPGAGITSDVAPGSGPGTETARAPVNEIGTGSGSGTKDCPKVIGVIGRLDPIKDHPTLFRAFAQVARSMPEIQLMVIGDGPERQKLESMAETLVEADIRFTGNRLDVPDLLRQITGKKARESVIRRFSMADMAAGYSGV